jgi:hypothetical protein
MIFAQGAAVVAVIQSCRLSLRPMVAIRGRQRSRIVAAQLAIKAFADETRAAAGDVDELADQIRIDLGDDVVEDRSTSSIVPLELGGVVVAQPLGIELLFR